MDSEAYTLDHADSGEGLGELAQHLDPKMPAAAMVVLLGAYLARNVLRHYLRAQSRHPACEAKRAQVEARLAGEIRALEERVIALEKAKGA
jgi:hypothetical protein